MRIWCKHMRKGEIHENSKLLEKAGRKAMGSKALGR